MATWEAPGLTPRNDDAPDDLVWIRLRYRRDQMLAACDWAMTPDAPTDKNAWSAYRQALRDLPSSVSDPREAVWPTPPAV